MSNFLTARRAGVPALVMVIGTLVATPAYADVTVSPTTAVQGSGENLTFHVTNTGAKPLGTVSLRLPADEAIAEMYPLSADDWAPKTQLRTLATPLATIHGGTPVTEAPSAITWLAMPGRALAPGKSTDLSVAVGPLPTISSLRFTIVTTYADGTAGPNLPAAVSLTPPLGGSAATGHSAHDAAKPADTSGAEEAVFAAAVAEAQRGPSIWAIGGWVVAALALIGVAVTALRGRHRAKDDDEPEDEDETKAADEAAVGTKATDEAGAVKEPVTAGKWSLRA